MSNLEKFDRFKKMYLLEKHRVESFKEWPFENNASCSILKMAEAGFYWSGTKRETDTATCFVCAKTLDGWEANDDPWKEHIKHAPQCLFVKYGRKEQELTVEEFMRMFYALIKNKVLNNLTKETEDLQKSAAKDLETFLMNK